MNVHHYAEGMPSGHTIFISFSSADLAVAESLLQEIESRAITAFFAPRDISVGENFAQRIVEAIVASDCVVVLLSEASIESPHVRREVSLAIDERRQLVPIVLGGIRFPQDFSSEWSYWLSAVQIHTFDSVGHVADLVAKAPDRVRSNPVPQRAEPEPELQREVIPAPLSPVVMLRPERRVVPFVGRQDDLARLEAWLNRDGGLSVRLVTAPAGEGKSRLALELADHASQHGWVTMVFDDPSQAAARTTGPTLVIIDYAETKAEEVGSLLTRLIRSPQSSRVRILLLARSAGDWWRALSSSTAEIEDLLADSTVHSLQPIDADPAGTGLYTAAAAAFSRALGRPVPLVPADTTPGESLLDILQRALLSVLADSDEGNPGRIVSRLLGHERRYVRSAAGTDLAAFDDLDFERVAVAYSLFPPRDESDATSLVFLAQPAATQAEARRIARLLRRLYPADPGYSSGLKPDAVAELALANYLEENASIPGGPDVWGTVDESRFEIGLRLLARAAPRSVPAAAELSRLVATLDLTRIGTAISIAVQIEDPSAIVSGLSSAVESGALDDRIADILALMPDETLGLAGLAASTAARVVATANTESVSGQTLIEASNRFSDAGWSERALTAARGGITALRSSGTSETDPILSIALSNLSNRLWESGSLAESLTTAEESLRPVDGQDALTEIAARNNAAFRMLDLGRYGDARAQLDLVSAIGEPAEDGTTRARVRLQAVMSNRVCLEAAEGNWAEAASIARSLVTTRRQDFSAYRDRNTAYLARALANAAIPMAASGATEEAHAAIAEARSLHQVTAGKAPIFRFEAAESALIQALVFVLDGSGELSLAALDAADSQLGMVGPSVGELAPRLAGAIDHARTFATSSKVGDLRMLQAVGSTDTACELQFPLLLEYKDL